MMTTLQIVLAIVGVVLIGAIVVYNLVQERRFRREADRMFSHRRNDIMLGESVRAADQAGDLAPRISFGDETASRPEVDQALRQAETDLEEQRRDARFFDDGPAATTRYQHEDAPWPGDEPESPPTQQESPPPAPVSPSAPPAPVVAAAPAIAPAPVPVPVPGPAEPKVSPDVATKPVGVVTPPPSHNAAPVVPPPTTPPVIQPVPRATPKGPAPFADLDEDALQASPPGVQGSGLDADTEYAARIRFATPSTAQYGSLLATLRRIGKPVRAYGRRMDGVWEPLTSHPRSSFEQVEIGL